MASYIALSEDAMELLNCWFSQGKKKTTWFTLGQRKAVSSVPFSAGEKLHRNLCVHALCLIIPVFEGQFLLSIVHCLAWMMTAVYLIWSCYIFFLWGQAKMLQSRSTFSKRNPVKIQKYLISFILKLATSSLANFTQIAILSQETAVTLN